MPKNVCVYISACALGICISVCPKVSLHAWHFPSLYPFCEVLQFFCYRVSAYWYSVNPHVWLSAPCFSCRTALYMKLSYLCFQLVFGCRLTVFLSWTHAARVFSFHPEALLSECRRSWSLPQEGHDNNLTHDGSESELMHCRNVKLIGEKRFEKLF